MLDYGVLWPGQSDVFVPSEPPTPDTPAWLGSDDARTQAELLEDGRRAPATHPGCDCSPTCTRPPTTAVPAFLGPLLSGGSLVLLRDPQEQTWPARLEDERADVQLRA